jgi:alpha-tubulin suppressor-like RCC1 family protein
MNHKIIRKRIKILKFYIPFFILSSIFSTINSQVEFDIYAFGLNDYGQTGLGFSQDKSYLTKIGNNNDWDNIECGKYHVVSNNLNGELKVWGNNDNGRLGTGDFITKYVPLKVGSYSNFVNISASGEGHNLGINSNGELFAWGSNSKGQLGLGNNTDFSTPQKVGNLSNWIYITTGEFHSLAINSNGELFAWGLNSEGQLGLGNNSDYNTPQQVGNSTDWIEVSSFGNHTIAINSSGELYSWGLNSYGQLGIGNTSNMNSPQKVGTSTNWSSVKVGENHSIALNSNGEIFGWGNNQSGQVGVGNYPSTFNTPQRIGYYNNWVEVSAGGNNSGAITSSGNLYLWGNNEFGQLGIGNTSLKNTPQKVGTAANWEKIDIGSSFIIAKNDLNEIFSCGSNLYGQLGIGKTTNQVEPLKLSNSIKWKLISCNAYHSLGIDNNGYLYAWGRNWYGELGINNYLNYNSPQQIGYSNNWKYVSAGWGHSLAINQNNELYAWGDNSYGALGIGNNNNQFVPTRVGAASNWNQFSAGFGYTIALNNNGELYAWGLNGDGQLGIGNNLNKNTPTKIGTKSNYISISTNYSHTLAIDSDGKLFSWGNNAHGELGLGNNIDQNSPQQVGTAENWVTASTGMFNSFAINADGELFAWGYNNDKSLGIGNSINQYTPVKVGTESNWKSISAGYFHAIAINQKGEVFCWGLNENGQLGQTESYVVVDKPTKMNDSLNWEYVETGGYSSFLFCNKSYFWRGSGNFNLNYYWDQNEIPSSNGFVNILSGTMTVNQATNLDAVKINNNSTVKLTAPLTVRNLHLNNGTIDLNGHRLTITGGIYQSTDSSNYYIQAGTAASPKPNSELVFASTANTSSTIYFNPNANTLKVLEIGTSSKTAQVTLGNALNIKGGKTPSNGGSIKINKGSKIIIPNGASLTLQSDTFNAYLDLATPAQRAIHCSGTGTFNIERQHYGARGWRLYSHPFNANLDLQQVADDIELIGSGGTSEGFYSDAHTNNAAFWYDYSKADTTATTDLAWTAFSSAKGSVISGNANKWKKHSPIILFNPGAVRGSGAFSNPASATYQEGKITLSYILDSTAVHLNDGKTQTISTAELISAPKSRYFFLTNPFTAPVRLGRVQGLNLTNCANKFYYWKQNHASISSNFMPAAWASEALFNGNATRDSNISIPAFGTILIEMKDPSVATTFTIPESAKQLSNFNYIVGGDLSNSSSGVKQTTFLEIPQTFQGPGAIEVQLLMNDSVPVDRMLIYDRTGESASFTNNDAKKFKEPSFSNIYSLSRSGESLSLDAQDINARLNSGEDQVEIPLVIDRDFNKTQKNLRLRIWEKHTDLQCYFKDSKSGNLTPAESFSDIPVEFSALDANIHRYSLVFKRSSTSTEDFKDDYLARGGKLKPEVIVYPNPANDVLHVRVLNGNGKLSYQIYSITGVKVLEGSLETSEKIYINALLQPGIYIMDAGGQKVKFVKE